MGKCYTRLSANVPTADMIVNAILNLRRARTWDKLPVSDLFSKMNGSGTNAEAKRILDYLIKDRVIIKDSKKFRWNGDVSVWENPDKRRTYVLEMLHHSREDMPEIIQKPGSKRSVMNLKQNVVFKVAPKQEDSAKGLLCGPDGKFDFLSHSDDELSAILQAVQKEFARREEVRKKQARLQEVLELAEMSRDELAELLGVI